MRRLLVLLFFVVSNSISSEYFVESAAQITAALSGIQPGDTLTMLDGEWRDQRIVFSGTGTEQNPILLRAQTPGSVILTGLSNLRISGSYLVVDGLFFTDGYSPSGAVIEFRGGAHAVNSRVTNTAIVNYNPPSNGTDYKWISLYGQNNRVDHCYLYGKNNSGTTLVVWLNGQPNYHQIDYNYFAFRPDLGENGGETIRIGTSTYSMTDSYTLVENNYFEHCNGEIEIISNKSGHNTFRYNTFFESEGALTLRHGNYATVTGNFFLGNNKARTGGVRVIGENHTIYNNYFQDLQGDGFRSALTIMNGVPDSPLNRYFQVINAHVLFNTFVNCRSNIVLGAGSDSERTLVPLDCNIDNNVILADPSRFIIDDEDEPINLNWSGNIFYGSGLGITQPQGISIIDPMLAEAEDGLWRPQNDSPLLGAAVGEFAFVTTDMDGHSRADSFDIGADQRSADPVLIRPLTGEDVGPAWYPPAEIPNKVIYVQAGLDSLSSAVFNVLEGDTIELVSNGGIYTNNSIIEINKSVLIRAADDLTEQPVIQNISTDGLRILFQITSGGSLQLDGLELDGMAGSATPAKYLLATDLNPMQESYSLRLNDCYLHDVVSGSDGNFFRAYPGTFADSIIFNDCLFFNSGKEGIRLKDEVSGSALYNVAYFEMTNCTMWHTNKEAVYIYGGDDIIFTPGPRIRINHCTFNDCGYNEGAVIKPLKVDDTQIINSIIANSTGVSPSILLDGVIAQIAFCDTFNISGIVVENDATIGAGMLGFDPLFNNAGSGDFTLDIFSPLLGQANDGQAMGDLRWADVITVLSEDRMSYEPSNIALVKNYPNPFNPATTIEFTLQQKDHVSIVIFNQQGKMVKLLNNSTLQSGNHKFVWDAALMSSGLYFYKISSSRFQKTGKMVLLK